MWVLNLSDGKHDLIDIANTSGCSIDLLINVAKNLKSQGILSKSDL